MQEERIHMYQGRQIQAPSMLKDERSMRFDSDHFNNFVHKSKFITNVLKKRPQTSMMNLPKTKQISRVSKVDKMVTSWLSIAYNFLLSEFEKSLGLTLTALMVLSASLLFILDDWIIFYIQG